MGLLQKACETYDNMKHLAGQAVEGRETLAPIAHIMARAQIEITLNQQGKFVTAREVDKKEPKIPIPATEDSAGRTQTPCPHPLCDNLAYLAPDNQDKHQLYLKQLANWTNSAYTNPKLPPILHYVQSGHILQDLANAQIIKPNGASSAKYEKLLVCWRVNGLGMDSGPCWTDPTLMQSFADYYKSIQQEDNPQCLCMISGQTETPAKQHLKGVVPFHGNAKLISSNDKTGFTYRGRFAGDWEAATVGYSASQKAHNALRWLAANQGVNLDGRTFICWNPQGYDLPKVTGFMAKQGELIAATPTDYRQKLQEALQGWQEKLPSNVGVVIAALDASTNGRLSITYYNELIASDFLNRLHHWEKSCCWENGSYNIESPALYEIVKLAFGTHRNGKIEIDPKISRQQIQRLVACRINQAPFPLDIEKALVAKASQLTLYEPQTRQKLLFTTCAAIKKYHNDYFKEELDMALDFDNTNRSYLFGRLLAIADIVERSAHSAYKDEERETNAMRMQKAYALRPMTGWRILEEKLQPYYKQLPPKLAQHYRHQTEEIVNRLSATDSNLNQKLEDIYLIGFYQQKAYRSDKTENNKKSEEEN